MDWNSTIKGYSAWLRLEKGLSGNSVEAYLRDVGKLQDYISANELLIAPELVSRELLQEFLGFINELGIGERSQARILSGLRSFYTYLQVEELIISDPTELIDSPKLGRKLPEVLSIEEIDKILESFDMSEDLGVRNRAMLETLYSCGLRVSELINLKISCFYPELGFIRVIGKGDKERLVPIGESAVRYISMYLEHVRVHLTIKKGHEDILFLNRRGKQLTRVMIFLIIKQAVELAGLKVKVSPHTFRHSFATHLVEGGASLRAVQEMLGHESITTTEIYTHLDRDFLRATLVQFHPRFNKQ